MLTVRACRNVNGGADVEHGEIVRAVDLIYFRPAHVEHVSCASEHPESHR